MRRIDECDLLEVQSLNCIYSSADSTVFRKLLILWHEFVLCSKLIF